MLVDNIALIIKQVPEETALRHFFRTDDQREALMEAMWTWRRHIFSGSTDTDLRQFRFQKELRAEDGVKRKKKNLTGRMGKT